jgi:hypothetical protein
MRDIVSRGRDREPGPWRRRGPRVLAAAAVVLLAVVLIVVHLPHHARAPAQPRPSAAARPAPEASGAASSGAVGEGVIGPTLPWQGGSRLPVSGAQPAWLWPATGRTTLIGGLPRDSSGYQFTRVNGGWAIQPGPGDPAPGCSGCSGAPLPVYFLGDGARSAIGVGLAGLVAPGAAPGQLWLTSYRPGANLAASAGTAREVSVTGKSLGPQVTLPAGQVIMQATDRGLLLGPLVASSRAAAYKLWNPADRRASRSFGEVIAASATEVAWVLPGCTPACQVQVLDLTTGGLTTVTLPGGSSAASGAFSPDGRFLALEASFYDGGSLAAQLDVASPTTGRLTAVPGTWVSSDALVGFGWPASDDSLVAELSFTTRIQVASWRPGAATLAVAGVRPGRESSSLVVG